MDGSVDGQMAEWIDRIHSGRMDGWVVGEWQMDLSTEGALVWLSRFLAVQWLSLCGIAGCRNGSLCHPKAVVGQPVTWTTICLPQAAYRGFLHCVLVLPGAD